MTGPMETGTTRKTTGNNNVPGSVTKQPKNSYAYDNTVAPFNHDGNDVSGYVGVDSYYRTYADTRNKPLNVNGFSNGYALSERDAMLLGLPEGTVISDSELDGELPQLVAGSGVELVGPVFPAGESRDEEYDEGSGNSGAPNLSAPQPVTTANFSTKKGAEEFADANELNVDKDLKSEEYQEAVRKAFADKQKSQQVPAPPAPLQS